MKNDFLSNLKTGLLVAFLIYLVAGLIGCASFNSQITTPTLGTFILPKDANIGYLRIVRSNFEGEHIELLITNSTWTMNPMVIDATTRRDQALIDAAVKAAVSAMMKGAMVP